MYCRNCGKELESGQAFCPYCGASQDPSVRNNNGYQQPPQNYYDSGSVGWAVLGFLVPLVGFILWLAWQRDRPKCARMAGLGALASVIAGVVVSILMFAMLFAFGETTTTTEIMGGML